jgi:glycosyltransferase involved in cell wall biosynthesis
VVLSLAIALIDTVCFVLDFWQVKFWRFMNRQLNLLFVVPYVPNPVRVRPYQFIRTLCQRGHHITLATLPTGDEDASDLQHLQALGVTVLTQTMPAWHSLLNVLFALPSSTPLQAVYSRHPALAARLRHLLAEQRFDAIHVEHLRGSHYALALTRAVAPLPAPPPVIWDSVDSISYLFEQAAQLSRSWKGRLMTQLELGRTRRYEGWLVHQFSRTLVTSPIDKAMFERLSQTYPSKQHKFAAAIEVVANGVDTASFAYHNGVDRPLARLVFSGKMSYHANVTAALHLVKDIMPAVWSQRPDAEVWIVGKDPAPEVQALANSTGDAVSAPVRKVVVTGTVESLPPYLQGATVAVAPLLYGAGVQNKVLEAMACGAPVVASQQATAALNVQAGRELLVATNPGEFSQSILQLLENPAQRVDLGRAARRFVETHHTWAAAGQKLEGIYLQN